MTKQTFSDFRAVAITDVDVLAERAKLSSVELYMVYALGGSSFVSKYIVKNDLFDFSQDYIAQESPEIFAEYNHIWLHTNDGYASSHCLGDMNLEKKTNCNQHLCFLSEKEANIYKEWCKINTASPEIDYLDDIHEYEDYYDSSEYE